MPYFLRKQIPTKICEDCGGSGICSECNGEGFVLKKLSEVSAERARSTAKNMATRYTAGYIFPYLSLSPCITLDCINVLNSSLHCKTGFQRNGVTVLSVLLPVPAAPVVAVGS